MTRTTNDGVSGDSSDATKTYVDARISITPDGTNAVGNPHTFTITLEKNLGAGGGWVAFAGQTVTASFVSNSAGATFATGPTCTTNAAGTCTVSITSTTPGTSVVKATFTGLIVAAFADTNVTRATGDSHVGDGVNRTKTFVDARIGITPDGVNAIGVHHELTITLEKNLGLGGGWVAFAGQTVTATIDTGTCTFVGAYSGTTDALGQLKVTITSSIAQTCTIGATFTGDIVPLNDNTNVTRTTGDGHTGDSVDATKVYLSATISIGENGTNAVTVDHTFTITLKKDSGSGLVGFPNQTVSASIATGTCTFVGPSSGTTDANGQFTVVIHSATPQICTVSATFDGDIEPGNDATHVVLTTDGTGGNSNPAQKTFVDARIHITPSGTNTVGTNHTFTIHLEKNLGSGWGDFAGQTVTAAIVSDSASSTFVGERVLHDRRCRDLHGHDHLHDDGSDGRQGHLLRRHRLPATTTPASPA